MARTAKAIMARQMRDPAAREYLYDQMKDEKVLTCRDCGRDWSATPALHGYCSQCAANRPL
jgi:hypothetical protein